MQNPKNTVFGINTNYNNKSLLERSTKEGDSPVYEIICWFMFVLPSTIEHEKFCGNLPGPSGKAKYYLMTDSEQVP